MTEQIRQFATDQCLIHPLNRKQLGDMAKFKNDIKANGIEVPLIGRLLDSEQTKKLYPRFKMNGHSQAVQILAGGRRLTAAKALKLENVPVIERDLDDHAAFIFLMRENLHREQVDPMDESDYFNKQVGQGRTIEEITADIGMSDSYVRRRLVLQNLVATAKALLADSTISAAIAMEMARLPDTSQESVIEEIGHFCNHNDPATLTPARVREMIRDNEVLTLKGTAFSLKDAKLTEAGPCHLCDFRTGSSPSLFGDLSEEDACLNRACFNEKCEANLLATIAKHNKRVQAWHPLINEYYYVTEEYEGEKVLSRNHWEHCKKTDEGALCGVIIGKDYRIMGKTVWFTKTGSNGAPKPTPQEKAARSRELREGRIKAHHRRSVFQTIQAQPVDRETIDMRRIAITLFRRHHSETQKVIIKELEWAIETHEEYDQWDHVKTCERALSQMSDEETLRFLHGLTVANWITQSPWDNSDDELMDYAAELGIDTDDLLEKSKAVFPPKKGESKKLIEVIV